MSGISPLVKKYFYTFKHRIIIFLWFQNTGEVINITNKRYKIKNNDDSLNQSLLKKNPAPLLGNEILERTCLVSFHVRSKLYF